MHILMMKKERSDVQLWIKNKFDYIWKQSSNSLNPGFKADHGACLLLYLSKRKKYY